MARTGSSSRSCARRHGEDEGEAGVVQPAPPRVQERQVPEEAARRADCGVQCRGRLQPRTSLASVNGLTHRDQRLANGGNQFSLEPPDQALCVGNGFVVEAVNSVLRVRSAANGAALTGVQDLNTFFGYPAAINRTTGVIGPQVIDPVCHYDPDNQRFMVVITTLRSAAERRLHRQEHDRPRRVQHRRPDGPWTIYHVPAQNDGTDGTPDHGCTLDGVDATARASRTTRTSAVTPTASTSRPTSTTCSGRTSTPRRSSPSPRRSSPPTRPAST